MSSRETAALRNCRTEKGGTLVHKETFLLVRQVTKSVLHSVSPLHLSITDSLRYRCNSSTDVGQQVTSVRCQQRAEHFISSLFRYVSSLRCLLWVLLSFSCISICSNLLFSTGLLCGLRTTYGSSRVSLPLLGWACWPNWMQGLTGEQKDLQVLRVYQSRW